MNLERLPVSTTSTAPKDGEHTISYAYPSSPRAEQLGMGRSGCHVIETANVMKGYSNLQAAVDDAKKGGTAPTRWSIDHPENSHLTA